MGALQSLLSLVAGAAATGGLLTAFYNSQVGEAQTRQERLTKLVSSLDALREAEVEEVTADVREFNRARAADPGTAQYRSGVDPDTILARQRAQQRLNTAFAVAVADARLRDCVTHFQEAVKATLFAHELPAAAAGNRASSFYLHASETRINELVNQNSWDLLFGRFEHGGPRTCPEPSASGSG